MFCYIKVTVLSDITLKKYDLLEENYYMDYRILYKY